MTDRANHQQQHTCCICTAATPMRVATATEAQAWRPLLDAPSQNCTACHTRSIVNAERGGTTIIVCRIRDVSLQEFGAYVRLSDEQVAKHPALLNRLEPETLEQADALLGLAWHGERLVAGAHGIFKTTADGEAVVEWSGLVSDGSQRGIGRVLLASLILADEHERGVAVEGRSVARIMPDGLVNVGSTKTLMHLGFYASDVIEHPVTLKNPQKGLEGSAVPDGGALQYLVLRGDPQTTTESARSCLKGWKISFGASCC